MADPSALRSMGDLRRRHETRDEEPVLILRASDPNAVATVRALAKIAPDHDARCSLNYTAIAMQKYLERETWTLMEVYVLRTEHTRRMLNPLSQTVIVVKLEAINGDVQYRVTAKFRSPVLAMEALYDPGQPREVFDAAHHWMLCDRDGNMIGETYAQ